MAPTPAKRISTEAYQALRDALPLVVWYKRSFNRYLRTALRAHPELLNGIDFDASKREVADEVVDRLIRNERNYQAVTLQLMLEVANTSRFPELERHEDSEQLLKRAHAAVSALKAQTHRHEQLIIEQQRIEAERAAYVQQAELQRRFSDELDELKEEFFRLASMSDNPQQRGREFEKLLTRLFDLFDLEPRMSYLAEHEQIDGAFSFDTDDYIIEAKWTQKPTGVPAANHFATKVRNKGKNALGLLLSVHGFTQDALDEYKKSTPFMTMDYSDLICVLEQRARLDDILRRKKRHANETGECYFPVSRLFE